MNHVTEMAPVASSATNMVHATIPVDRSRDLWLQSVMNDMLKAARDEKQKLLERLKAVQEVIRAYGGEPASAGDPRPASTGVRRTRAPSERTQKIRDLVTSLLSGQADPVPTRDILVFVLAEGIEVVGSQPVSTLSALLSHSEEFESHGRAGWTLMRDIRNAEGPDVAPSEPSMDDRGTPRRNLDLTSDSPSAHLGE